MNPTSQNFDQLQCQRGVVRIAHFLLTVIVFVLVGFAPFGRTHGQIGKSIGSWAPTAKPTRSDQPNVSQLRILPSANLASTIHLAPRPHSIPNVDSAGHLPTRIQFNGIPSNEFPLEKVELSRSPFKPASIELAADHNRSGYFRSQPTTTAPSLSHLPPSPSPESASLLKSVLPADDWAPTWATDEPAIWPPGSEFHPANHLVVAPSLDWNSGTGQRAKIKTRLKNESVFVQPQDEIWLVSARNNQDNPVDLSRLEVQTLRGGQWHPASLNQLTLSHQTNKARRTMVFVHGNRTNFDWAVSRGMQTYRNLFSHCGRRPPLRMVIFAWKSEREIPLPILDYRRKATNSVEIGTTFGLMLNQFGNRNLMLVGYSLGAQVVLAGLQHESLGQSAGQYELSLVAPAFDCGWLAQQEAFVPTQPKVKRGVFYVNSEDRVIRVAKHLCQKQFPNRELDPEQLAKFGKFPLAETNFVDLTEESSWMHSIVLYTRAPSLRTGIYQQLIETCRGCRIPLFNPVAQ